MVAFLAYAAVRRVSRTVHPRTVARSLRRAGRLRCYRASGPCERGRGCFPALARRRGQAVPAMLGSGDGRAICPAARRYRPASTGAGGLGGARGARPMVIAPAAAWLAEPRPTTVTSILEADRSPSCGGNSQPDAGARSRDGRVGRSGVFYRCAFCSSPARQPPRFCPMPFRLRTSPSRPPRSLARRSLSRPLPSLTGSTTRRRSRRWSAATTSSRAAGPRSPMRCRRFRACRVPASPQAPAARSSAGWTPTACACSKTGPAFRTCRTSAPIMACRSIPYPRAGSKSCAARAPCAMAARRSAAWSTRSTTGCRWRCPPAPSRAN